MSASKHTPGGVDALVLLFLRRYIRGGFEKGVVQAEALIAQCGVQYETFLDSRSCWLAEC